MFIFAVHTKKKTETINLIYKADQIYFGKHSWQKQTKPLKLTRIFFY